MFGVWSLVSLLNSVTAKSKQRFSMVDYHKFLAVIQWRGKNETKLKVETLLTDRYTLSGVARRAPRATRAMKVKPLCPSGTPRSSIGRARVSRGVRSRITVYRGGWFRRDVVPNSRTRFGAVVSRARNQMREYGWPRECLALSLNECLELDDVEIDFQFGGQDTRVRCVGGACGYNALHCLVQSFSSLLSSE